MSESWLLTRMHTTETPETWFTITHGKGETVKVAVRRCVGDDATERYFVAWHKDESLFKTERLAVLNFAMSNELEVHSITRTVGNTDAMTEAPDPDDEFWDGTDAAHPAWWRGEKHSHDKACDILCREFGLSLPSDTDDEPKNIWSVATAIKAKHRTERKLGSQE